MAFAGNPKKYARDIGDGYVLLSPVLLKGYDLDALRTLKQAVEIVLRDVRSEVAPAGDLMAVQERQRRLLRLNQSLQVIRAFAFKRRLAL